MKSRTRSRGAFTTVTYSGLTRITRSRWGGCQNPLTDQVSSYPNKVEVVGDHQTMTDVLTENFRARSQRGEVIMSPMFRRRTIINPAVMSGKIVYSARALQCSGPSAFRTLYTFPCEALLSFVEQDFTVPPSLRWGPRGSISGTEIENAILEASTRCHSERGRSPINLWEAIAERKQSYALLGEYMKQAKEITIRMHNDAVNGRLSVPRKFYRMSRRLFNVAAGSWLISRYGLLPLLKDIQALKKQLGSPLDEAERHTSRGKAVAGRSVQSATTYSWDGEFNLTFNRLTTDEIQVRAMSLDEWKFTTLDHIGLGSKDLVSLPWELLTLSFVADWFVNIGDFIGGLVPTPGVNQLGSCFVLSQTTSLTVTSGLYQPVSPAEVRETATLTKTGTVTERSRVVGIRAPSLVVLNRSKIDPEYNKNTMRIVDASALVGQRLNQVLLHLDKSFPFFKK